MFSTPVVLNNQIISRLTGGSAEAVEKMVEFGIRPEQVIDRTEMPTTVERASAWAWSHQAPVADGVVAWWLWVDRYIASMGRDPAAHAAQVLGGFLVDGLKAALPLGRVATAQETWNRSLRWEGKIPRWSRAVALRHAVPVIARAGDAAASFVSALSLAGSWQPSDWSLSSRSAYAEDPLRTALWTHQGALVEALVEAGVKPDGASLSLAWDRRPLSVSSLEHAGCVRALTSLLRAGADWEVPAGGGQGSVREALLSWCDRHPEWTTPSFRAAVAQRRLESGTSADKRVVARPRL